MAMSEELKQVSRWGGGGQGGGHQTKENGTCVRNTVQIFWMMFLMGPVKKKKKKPSLLKQAKQ